MIHSLLTILQLGLDRLAVRCDRPDILREFPDALLADQCLADAFAEQANRLASAKNFDLITERLVWPGRRRRSEAEITGVTLVFRIASIPHSARQLLQYGVIRRRGYDPALWVESASTPVCH